MIAAATVFSVAISLGVLARASVPEVSAAEEAVRLTNASEYALAADAYARAFEETGESVYLYARAMSLRRAGICEAAIVVFEQFIETEPPQADVEAARAQISECDQLLDRPPVASASAPVSPEPAAEPLPSPRQATPEPSPVASPGRGARNRGWIRDGLGGALTGGGVLIAATGGALFGVAANSANVPPGETERGHADRIAEVRRTSIAAVSLLAIGGALVVGGVVRYVVVGRRRHNPNVSTKALRWHF